MEPDSLTLDDAALLVVDMQNDFITGSLLVPGAETIIPTVNLWIEIFEDLEQPVLYSMDWHPTTTPHFDRWPVHCVAGSVGAQIHPDVIYDPIGMRSVYVVQKGLGQDDGYSACSQPSELFCIKDKSRLHHFDSVASILATEKIQAVIVVGLATDFCVRASVLDLLKMGKRVYLVLDATVGVDRQSDRDALIDMSAAGARFISDEELLPRVEEYAIL